MKFKTFFLSLGYCCINNSIEKRPCFKQKKQQKTDFIETNLGDRRSVFFLLEWMWRRVWVGGGGRRRWEELYVHFFNEMMKMLQKNFVSDAPQDEILETERSIYLFNALYKMEAISLSLCCLTLSSAELSVWWWMLTGAMDIFLTGITSNKISPFSEDRFI